MTAPISSTSVPEAPKQSSSRGCVLTIVTILFSILGIYDLVVGSIFTYMFSSARMFSLARIAIVLIIAFDCLIYFLLTFRVKRQHWLISLGLLAMVWLILPRLLYLAINISTARVRVDGYSMGT